MLTYVFTFLLLVIDSITFEQLLNLPLRAYIYNPFQKSLSSA